MENNNFDYKKQKTCDGCLNLVNIFMIDGSVFQVCAEYTAMRNMVRCIQYIPI